MSQTVWTACLPGVVHVAAAGVDASKLQVKMTVICSVMGFLSDKYQTATKQVLRHARQLHTYIATHTETTGIQRDTSGFDGRNCSFTYKFVEGHRFIFVLYIFMLYFTCQSNSDWFTQLLKICKKVFIFNLIMLSG